MEIKNEKIKKILFNSATALKKMLFVFNSEFTIPVVFSVLLFFLILPIIIINNLEGQSYFKYEFLIDTFMYLSLSCFAGIIATTIGVFFTKKKWFQTICGATGFGIARLLIFMSEYTPGSLLEYWGFLIVLCIMFMFAVYSGTKKNEALLYTFAKVVHTLIVVNFISIGFLLCEALFFNFVVNNNQIFFDWFAPITYLFDVCIVGSCYFFANIQTNSQDTPPLSKIEKGWYHFCLLIIFSVYIFVLYSYFIKIVFVRTLPEGIIGYFVSIATAAYMFMYFSQKQFDDAWTKWFYKIGAYVMLPLIIMQCLAIYQRISAYGLTGTRICNIGCVLITLVFIALTFYKQGLHIRKIFPFAAVLIFLLMIQPFGAQRIAIMQQTAHFERLLIKNGMLDKETKVLTPAAYSRKYLPDAETKKELNSIGSIYNYLEERKSLPEYCKGKSFSLAFGFEKNSDGQYIEPKIEYTKYKWEKGYGVANQIIDVSNFNHVIYRAIDDSHSYNSGNSNKKCYININNDYGHFDSIDITDFITENFSALENRTSSLQLKIDKNKIVEFVEIEFDYDEENKTFKNRKFKYYILMK